MAKWGFKVGDKVRLKHPKLWSFGNVIGVVVRFDNYVRVTWDNQPDYKADYPHLPKEIELAVKPGEQLMLFDL